MPLDHLFDGYRHSVENRLCSYTREERLLMWTALDKEVSQGFGEVHLSGPALEPGCPDVFCEEVPRRPEQVGLPHVGGEEPAL